MCIKNSDLPGRSGLPATSDLPGGSKVLSLTYSWISLAHPDGRCNTDRSECIVCAEERKELSLPAAAGGLKTMGYGRLATHRPGGVLPGGHSPSVADVACALNTIALLNTD
jgi:hypothetical protein